MLVHADAGGEIACNAALHNFEAIYTKFCESYEQVAVKDLCLDDQSDVVKDVLMKMTQKQEVVQCRHCNMCHLCLLPCLFRMVFLVGLHACSLSVFLSLSLCLRLCPSPSLSSIPFSVTMLVSYLPHVYMSVSLPLCLSPVA